MTTENRIEISVRGSSGNSYTVRFSLEENRITAFCSCPAGDNQQLCKHVIRIMNGDDSILYDSSQKQDFVAISSHLKRTTVPSLLSKLSESEVALHNAANDAKRAKKALERAVLRK